MQAELLYSYLDGALNPDSLSSSIRSEVERWKLSLQKRGSSASVVLNPIDASYLVDSKNIKSLLDDFFAEKFTDFELLYIVDCLTLAPNVTWSSDNLRYMLEDLTAESFASDHLRSMYESVSRLIV